MNKITAQIILDIVKTEMGFTDKDVWLRDQNRVIPNDTGMYVIAGLVSAQVMSSHVYMQEFIVDNVAVQKQVSRVQQRESIQVDIIGRSNDILSRNWEVIGALSSFYSQQQQENNYFKIAQIPQSFTNTSSAEGGSILNRYTIIVPCIVWYYKEKSMPAYDYYGEFSARADDDVSIETNTPLFEFTI
jgi:hypothetical protein